MQGTKYLVKISNCFAELGLLIRRTFLENLGVLFASTLNDSNCGAQVLEIFITKRSIRRENE